MKKAINPIKHIAGRILFSLFFTLTFSSTSLGQDFGNGETGKDFIVSAKILSVAANIDSDRISLSSDGISNGPIFYQLSKSFYSIDSAMPSGNDFEFNLSLNIGNDEETVLKMDAIKLESYWHQTHFCAVYRYEKNETDFGLSIAYINNHLLEGMKIELQANSSAGSGGIFLKMIF